MGDLFVTYEIAIKLKELGFNEKCLAYWINENPKNSEGRCLVYYKKPYDDERITSSKILEYCYAPLYQQVIDWLYKEYGLWITIEDYTHSEPTDKLPNGFTFYITEYGCCVFGKDKSGHTYPPQKTSQLAIEKCLKLIEIE